MQNFELNQHGENVSVSFIRDSETLKELSQQWLEREVIAMDTEFDRTNTYFHKLSLIQIYDGEQIWFIDTLEFEDLSELKPVIESESLIKVFHSCSEDLEALFNSYHFQCNSIFDSQIAASFCDMGISLGYLRLIELFMGISLDKEQTKTDWMQRPLQEEQLIYAAQDVQFLLPAYYKLRDQLLEKGFFDYVMEDTASVFEAVSSPENFDQFYLRIKGTFRLNAKQTNRLKYLASWREQLARLKNTPKTFIFRDNQLLDICQKNNPKMSDLLEAGCHRASIRKYGAELLAMIDNADSIAEEYWPTPVKAFHKIQNGKSMLKRIRDIANLVADENRIPQDVLSNKRLLEYYIMQQMHLAVRPNRFWNEWRKELLSTSFEQVFASPH